MGSPELTTPETIVPPALTPGGCTESLWVFAASQLCPPGDRGWRHGWQEGFAAALEALRGLDNPVLADELRHSVDWAHSQQVLDLVRLAHHLHDLYGRRVGLTDDQILASWRLNEIKDSWLVEARNLLGFLYS